MPKYEVTITSSFAAAHNLRGYEGSCERLHGHNWKIEVNVGSDILDKLGMVIDFRVLRAEAEKVVGRLDHNYLNEVSPFDTVNPSAENIASYLFDEISGAIKDDRVNVTSVKVWESEGSAATYYGK